MASFADEMISIEVAYALPDKQKIVTLKVAKGTSVKDAALAAKMEEHFPGLDVATSKLGVFGKLVAKPEAEEIKAGERIEIYRPLIADPRASRQKRADKKEAAAT